MICECCKIDRLEKDFLKNQKFCFRCEYRKKVEKNIESRIPKARFCKVCGEEIFRDDGLKKRQRTIFCSEECAEKGHKFSISNHWTRKLRQYGN